MDVQGEREMSVWVEDHYFGVSASFDPMTLPRGIFDSSYIPNNEETCPICQDDIAVHSFLDFIISPLIFCKKQAKGS